jgi:hypothetical protein
MKPSNRCRQDFALDEPHSVKWQAVLIRSQPINWDDSRVLQVAGNLGLGDKPLAANPVSCVFRLNFFERDSAMQLAVLGKEDFAEPSLGVRPKHLITRSPEIPGHEHDHNVESWSRRTAS